MSPRFDADWQDRVHVTGERAAYIDVIAHAGRALGIFAKDDKTGKATLAAKLASFLSERHHAVTTLRRICEEHGDNDWPDNLWLPDIIEGHLGDSLGSANSDAAKWRALKSIVKRSKRVSLASAIKLAEKEAKL